MDTKTQLIMNILFFGILFLIPLSMMSLPEVWVEFSHLFATKKPSGKELARSIMSYKVTGVIVLALILTLLLLKLPGIR